MKVETKDLVALLPINAENNIMEHDNLIEKLDFSSIEIINFIIDLETTYSIVLDVSDMSMDNFLTIASIKKMLKKY